MKNGCLASLSVPSEVGEKIVIEGYEKLDDLHITLIRVLFDNDIVDDKTMRYHIVSSALKVGKPPNRGKLTKLHRFEGIQGGSYDALVIIVNIPGLYEWRQDFVDVLKQNGVAVDMSYKFNPHITLAYFDNSVGEDSYDIGPIHIGSGLVGQEVDFGYLEIRSNKNIFEVWK